MGRGLLCTAGGWIVITVAVAALAGEPATRPKDDDLDWLLSQKPAAPATAPASQPASPFEAKRDGRGARAAVLTLSNGERVAGRFATTRDKPLRLWDEQDKEFRDIPIGLVKSMRAEILWERDEREWHFKDSGSDIKEYSGKTYPARETRYQFTLVNGQTVTGGVVAPLYLVGEKETKLYTLNKRAKGEVGQTLKQLVYVRAVEFE